MVSDSVADFFTRLRNAATAGHETVHAPGSKFLKEVARVLKEQGFLDEVSFEPGAKPTLSVKLRYQGRRQPVLKGGRRVSRPGRRVYVAAKDIPRVRDGLGLAVVSTSQGVLTGHQAYRRGVGGEVLLEVW